MLTPHGRISKTYDIHVYAMHIRHKYAISEAGESLMARAGTARSRNRNNSPCFHLINVDILGDPVDLHSMSCTSATSLVSRSIFKKPRVPPKDFRRKINGDFEREGENLNSSSYEKQETPDLLEAGTSCSIKTLIIGFTVMFYISDTECPTRTSCPEGPSSAIVSSDSRLPRGKDDVAQNNSDGNDTTSKDISLGGRSTGACRLTLRVGVSRWNACLTKDQGNAKPALSAPYDKSPRDIFIPSDRKNELHLASSRNREIVKSLRTSPKRFLSTQFSFERRCHCRDVPTVTLTLDCSAMANVEFSGEVYSGYRDLASSASGAHRSGMPLTDGHQRFPQENNVYKNVDERYSVNMALALEAGNGDS
ncbi:hypothetical protein G5I_12901 [Acromyrmex echinatior]|uniref:Uncharacterized protein n=1 Tax=Acromyrmex echinatior TaxID=103372 RepID=F4X3Z8_ACREC|nr:hypothetical protein G5I_12901 [Acromyrmex echinatior]